MAKPRSAENFIKIFGMTNQIIETDLDQVEKVFDLSLGRKPLEPAGADDDYYPQFDEAIRKEAAVMGQHYEVFYCLEHSIRRLVSDTLKSKEGDKWWDSGRIPNQIHQDVATRIQRDVDTGTTLRSSEPLDFTNFGELGEIIKSNWDLFGAIFNSKRAVERVMSNLNTLRGPIAHCSALAEDEVLRLRLSVKDWFRLME